MHFSNSQTCDIIIPRIWIKLQKIINEGMTNMKIKEILEKDQISFSCEIFPPKKEGDFSEVFRVVDRISKIGVDFISVTYGAGGSTSKKTTEVAAYTQDTCGTTSLAHLTCIDSNPEQIKCQLADLRRRLLHPRYSFDTGNSRNWRLLCRRSLLSRGACGVSPQAG